MGSIPRAPPILLASAAPPVYPVPQPSPEPDPEEAAPVSSSDRWEDARRVEGWAGEVRVNLLRLAAILAFYGHHLVNVYLLQDDPDVRGAYHATVTALVVAWTAAAAVLHLCLTRRRVPPAVKYVSTLLDIVLTTALLAVTPAGPTSALLVLYFLIIASAPLRLSLPLVYVATLASMAGYVVLLGHYAYVVVGAERYYSEPELRVPHSFEVIFLLGLGAAGILAGQAVRQARRLVEGHAVAVAEAPEEKP